MWAYVYEREREGEGERKRGKERDKTETERQREPAAISGFRLTTKSSRTSLFAKPLSLLSAWIQSLVLS